MAVRTAPRLGVGPPLVLSFSSVPAIQAGEQLPIFWELKRLTHISDSVGSSVIASLMVNGTEIWSSSPVPVSAVSIGGDVIAEGTGLVQETLSFDPNSQAARLLYTAGMDILAFQVAGNGPHRDPFTAQANLTVIPGSFFGVWWSWNPIPTTPAWKSAYTLSGVFSNVSTAPLAVLRATLVENDLTDNSTAFLQTLNLGAVSTGTNTGPVAYTPITQAWQWIDDVTFVSIGPTIKNFSYTVQLSAQDPWGNQYQATSPALGLTVPVALSKINDQTAALAAAANAVNLTAAAAALVLAGAGDPIALAIAAGLFAAAATAYAAAQAFGSSAKDPPQPDPLYRQVVEKTAVEIPARLSGAPVLDALANLYREVLDIAAGHEALATARGRILGASEAKDRDALDRQIVRYREITKDMQEAALRLPAAAAQAIQTARSDSSLDPSKISTLLSQWKQNGIPPAVKASWVANDLPEGVFSAIESIVSQSPVEMLSATPRQFASIALRSANWAESAASQNMFAAA